MGPVYSGHCGRQPPVYSSQPLLVGPVYSGHCVRQPPPVKTSYDWPTGGCLHHTCSATLHVLKLRHTSLHCLQPPTYCIVLGSLPVSFPHSQLLDNTTIIFVMILSFLFLRVRYSATHIAGVGSCLVGVVLLVVADVRKASQGTGKPLQG